MLRKLVKVSQCLWCIPRSMTTHSRRTTTLLKSRVTCRSPYLLWRTRLQSLHQARLARTFEYIIWCIPLWTPRALHLSLDLVLLCQFRCKYNGVLVITRRTREAPDHLILQSKAGCDSAPSICPSNSNLESLGLFGLEHSRSRQLWWKVATVQIRLTDRLGASLQRALVVTLWLERRSLCQRCCLLAPCTLRKFLPTVQRKMSSTTWLSLRRSRLTYLVTLAVEPGLCKEL